MDFQEKELGQEVGACSLPYQEGELAHTPNPPSPTLPHFFSARSDPAKQVSQKSKVLAWVTQHMSS